MFDAPCDRAVPDQRDPLAAPGRDMAVERIPAGIEPAAGKPAIERRPRVVEHPVPAPFPIDRLRRLGPERLGLGQRAAMGLRIPGHRRPPTRHRLLRPVIGFLRTDASLPPCRPGEGRDPPRPWIPAFAGMTTGWCGLLESTHHPNSAPRAE